jgi:hypothetical protein
MKTEEAIKKLIEEKLKDLTKEELEELLRLLKLAREKKKKSPASED